MAATQCKVHLNVFRMKRALYKSGIKIIIFLKIKDRLFNSGRGARALVILTYLILMDKKGMNF